MLLGPTASAQTRSHSPAAAGVLDYLNSISGHATVAGIHNREPNSRPSQQTDRIFSMVGRYPGLWSGDFLFSAADVSNRWTMIHECKKEWEQGSIVQLMAHIAPPNQPEITSWRGGVMSHLSDPEWTDLVTDGGDLNQVFKTRLDGFAVYFQYWKDTGVPVLFRPFHEMNQKAFWWGGRHRQTVSPDPRLPGREQRAYQHYLGLGYAGHEPGFCGIQPGQRVLGYLRLRCLWRWVQPELVRLPTANRRQQADGDWGMRQIARPQYAGCAAPVVLLHELGRIDFQQELRPADRRIVSSDQCDYPGAVTQV